METAELIKFKDFHYERPDIDKYEMEYNSLLDDFDKAGSAREQFNILMKINKLRNDFDTMSSIARIRYTIDTTNDFYNKEHDYFDNVSPVNAGLKEKLYRTLQKSKYSEELFSMTGKELYEIAEVYNKTFSPEIIDDMKKENKLVTEYMKLIASAKIYFEGEIRNIAGMDPFMQSANRETRKNANAVKWKFFEDNEKNFDRIYDELVKVRTTMAKKLGYKNYIHLGYDRMGRKGYTPDDIQKFRESVKEYIVPVASELTKQKNRRLGVEKLYYYDSSLDFKDGNPVPKGSPEWIVERARKMYTELSAETGKFMELMIDEELMDLYNRDGKAAGGYCSYISNYSAPFIFANMNGTAHDVKVLTHEAGHAFQAYKSRDFEIIEYIHPTLEACEIHSMSMEFITWPWMELFFEEDTDKFLYSHLVKAVKFIPYGSAVDEFQHCVYENPEMTPDERKKLWSKIENKYLPMNDYEENDFLKRGGFWFHQGHIFRKPFYYIDYCLAQICALQFWRKCNEDRETAWTDYLNLCKAGGSKPFLELVELAKLESPFNGKVIEMIIGYCSSWLRRAGKGFE